MPILNTSGSSSGTSTDPLGLGGLPKIPTGSSSTNPLSTSSEDQLKVSGVGQWLRLNWGVVTVATAVQGLEQLAHASTFNTPGGKAAKAQLAALQAQLYAAGLYSRSQRPTLGHIKPTDLTAFKSAVVSAASNGADFGQWLNSAVSGALSNGTSGSGTHIIPAARVPEKVWSSQDILNAVEAATNGNGENLAQRLIGRNFTPAELSDIAATLNTAQQQQTNAQVAGILSQQQQQIAASQAAYGSVATGAGTGTVGSFLSAVRQHESGNNYTANSGDGAYGAYQFIPSTWNSAAKQAGYGQYANGRADKAPPKVQDAVASNMAQTYYRQYGSWEMAARAWYDPGYVNQPGYAPPGNNGLTVGAYGQDIVTLMGQNPSSGATTSVVNKNASSFSPVGPGLKQGRTDQGVDFSGSGPVFAVGSGTILSISNRGWPGNGAFIALKLDNPPDPQHSVVYYAEDIVPNVTVGQKVGGGATLGHATGGSTGIEIGWMNPNAPGQPLAQVTGGYTEGAVTQAGTDFLNFMKGSSAITGTAPGGAKGTITDVYAQPIVDQAPATLDPTNAATTFAGQNLAPQYQANNLLKVFQMIDAKLKNPDPGLAAHVRQTPIAMK
jgi:hypothetical protein